MARDDSIREMSIAFAEEEGFTVSPSLPMPSARELSAGVLRPLSEIAARLFALDCVFNWVAYPEDAVDSSRIIGYRTRNHLDAYLTGDEKGILTLSRQQAEKQYIDEIGWKLENIWPLAWVLGYSIPPYAQGHEIPQEITREILDEFLPGLNGTIEELLSNCRPVSEESVVAQEDLMYVIHNASRSAMMGQSTVPVTFNRYVDAQAIHERRHALTWCLSPGAAWEDTDLST